MRAHDAVIRIDTRGQGLVDITREVAEIVAGSGVSTGMCTVFVQHTSCSLVIQENADPSVLRDLQAFMRRLVPEDGSSYEHADEGPDDMPAHIRSAHTRTSEQEPVSRGSLALGTWQGIYLWEHRAMPHRRSVVVTVMGV